MYYHKEILCKRLKSLRIERKKSYANGKDPKTEKYEYCQTQEMFAEELNIDRRTLINWEKGVALPSLEHLLTICDLLDCNIDYFLGAEKFPYINTVSKASHFTGIKPEIISAALNDGNYLDCLNFFMLPENCADLSNEITLSAWKKFWINENIHEIKNPLLNIIYRAFDDFYLSAPMEKINPDVYKDYLRKYLIEKKLNFIDSGEKDSIIYVKKCLSTIIYKDFVSKCPVNYSQYDFFIDFICDLLYTSLLNRIYLELHKKKIADKFIEILNKYLSDMDE